MYDNNVLVKSVHVKALKEEDKHRAVALFFSWYKSAFPFFSFGKCIILSSSSLGDAQERRTESPKISHNFNKGVELPVLPPRHPWSSVLVCVWSLSFKFWKMSTTWASADYQVGSHAIGSSNTVFQGYFLKLFSKGGSWCNAMNIGVANLQSRKYFLEWILDNLV